MTDLTVEELLLLARERLEKGWCKWAYARNSDGDPVDALDPSATSWCLAGGIVADDEWSHQTEALRVLMEALKRRGMAGRRMVTRANDQLLTSQQDAVALVEEALEIHRGTA